MLLARTSSSPDEDGVYVGKLLEVSSSSMKIGREESITLIGFFGDAGPIEELRHVKVGDRIRVVFGAGIPPGGSRRINKLLSIRRCEKEDPQCDADDKAEKAKELEDEKARAASEKKYAACRDAMGVSLRDDPRFAPTERLEQEESDGLLNRFKSLSGSSRACANKLLRDHQAAVLDACELHHCGDNIGGGCAHISGYSISDAALERAIVSCKEK